MGETAEERKADWIGHVIGRQLDSIYCALATAQQPKQYLAYEQLWAVGTVNPATPEQA
jgi:triosephosphate isomerase